MDTVAYQLLRALAWFFNQLFCRYHMSGRELLPSTGPLLIVANHLSWYDPVLLYGVLPRRVWFFTKVEVFNWPVIGWLCRMTGQIPVQRGEGDRQALETAIAYLREGRAVLIFPEGTVERQEEMISAHPGVAMLALRSGATVVPLAHVGTRRVLRSWRIWFPHVQITIGPAFMPSLPTATSRKVGLQQVTTAIMKAVATLLPPERRGIYR